ncbi:MAG: hypothetical protein LBJ36_09230 [Synergistaceae bacterium]|jgi:predicted HTH transcriptional regulator|nr:hypothetical protein [Synergistaceae bacterium]
MIVEEDNVNQDLSGLFAVVAPDLDWRETLTLDSFLSLTKTSDRAFLSMRERSRFILTYCGMANGPGGWIVLGASLEASKKNSTQEKLVPVVEGIPDVAFLERELSDSLRIFYRSGMRPAVSFRSLSSGGKELLAVRVESAKWFLRPLCAGTDFSRDTYRRVDGVDVASSSKARLRMALDALEPLRDDFPVSGLSIEELDATSVASFRTALLKRFPQWQALSLEDFLKRSLVLSQEVDYEAGFEKKFSRVTRAGQLLLGKKDVLARITWKANTVTMADTKIWEARNIWTACVDLLPRFLEAVPITKPCEDALRECFVNTLLHADYDFGHVEIVLGEETAFFSNPGLPRAQTPGESEARNGRLLRILKLAGFARGEGKGLDVIRAFDEKFELLWDTLELSAVAALPLKITAALQPLGLPVVREGYGKKEDKEDKREDKKEKGNQRPERYLPAEIPPLLFKLMRKVPELPASFIDVLRSDSSSDIDSGTENLTEEPKISSEAFLLEEVDATSLPPLNEELSLEDEDLEEDEYEDEDEYAETSAENADERVNLPSSALAQMVRNTPRLSPVLVRNAILELCSEYRSLSDLALALGRSEGSLRRHYITVMIREGLLEAELSERIGHSDQRYRTIPGGSSGSTLLQSPKKSRDGKK